MKNLHLFIKFLLSFILFDKTLTTPDVDKDKLNFKIFILHIDMYLCVACQKSILHVGMNKEQEHCYVDWKTHINQI